MTRMAGKNVDKLIFWLPHFCRDKFSDQFGHSVAILWMTGYNKKMLMQFATSCFI